MENREKTRLADYRVGDWIFDYEGELKRIVEVRPDGWVVYTDGVIQTTSNGETSRCWGLSVRNLVLSNWLRSQKETMPSRAMGRREVREMMWELTEKLFDIPYGKDELTEEEIRQCNEVYKEIRDYIDSL